MERRARNVIIEGLTETGQGDWKALQDMFDFMGVYHRGYEIVGEPIRLGDRNTVKYGNMVRARRSPRYIKVIFRSEAAAREVLRASAKLKNSSWYWNVYIKRDMSREERMTEYAKRRRNTYGEASVAVSQQTTGSTQNAPTVGTLATNQTINAENVRDSSEEENDSIRESEANIEETESVTTEEGDRASDEEREEMEDGETDHGSRREQGERNADRAQGDEEGNGTVVDTANGGENGSVGENAGSSSGNEVEQVSNGVG